MTRRPRTSVLLLGYRVLLRALPPGLRREFGHDIEQLFRDRLREARDAGGVRGALRFAARSYRGLGGQVGRAWAEVVARRLRGAARDQRGGGARPPVGALGKRWRAAGTLGGPRVHSRRRTRGVGPDQAADARRNARGQAGRPAARTASVIDDLRSAVRSLARNRATSSLAVLAFAAGIGVTTTMYSALYGAVLRGLPFPESHRIVAVHKSHPPTGATRLLVDPSEYDAWRRHQTTFEELAAFRDVNVNLSSPDGPRRFQGAWLSASAFDALRAPAQLGRVFHADDETNAAPIILLGHHVWRDHFDADPDVVGSTVMANGSPVTIVGVMPEGFRFPVLHDVWLPLRRDATARAAGPDAAVFVFGRLADGVSRRQAEAQIAEIEARLAEEQPRRDPDPTISVEPFVTMAIDGETVSVLWAFQAAVFLVLLIACGNVSNLLLARSADRRRELTIRVALGAPRARLVRQLFAETLLLATLGGAIGLVIAAFGLQLLEAGLADIELPFFVRLEIEPPVVAFAALGTLLSGVLSGTIPALVASRRYRRGPTSTTTSRHHLRGLATLPTATQVALACTLLLGSLLFAESGRRLAGADYGFPTDRILTARVEFDPGLARDAAAVHRFYDELLAGLEGHPDVLAASLTSDLPLSGAPFPRLTVEGQAHASEPEYPGALMSWISPGFFETFDNAIVDVDRTIIARGILEGRDFAAGDRGGPPVAIVNASFARRFFGDRSPLGQRIRTGVSSPGPWLTIVGVVPDLYMGSMEDMDRTSPAAFYLPLSQYDLRAVSIAVRGRHDAEGLAGLLRREVAAVDPDLPIFAVRTMQEVLRDEGWFFSVMATMFILFGTLALGLVLVGLYSVVALSVRQRRPELGVRMALGARAGDLIALVLRRAVAHAAMGLVPGLAIALRLVPSMEVVLYDVDPLDLAIILLASALLLFVPLAAAWGPARRAARIDPREALRAT